MPAKRYLIVNADDFGQSPGVNRGIIEAHEQGIVTSTSLMVRWPGAAEAAAYSRTHPKLSLGIHIDLGEWVFRQDSWVALYEVVPPGDASAVEQEVSRQFAAFQRLAGRPPTHIDSHQHVHLEEPVRSAVLVIAEKLEIPVRHCSSLVRYCGEFYGQTADGSALPDLISLDALIKILAALEPGFTEMATHPGMGDDLDTMYCSERAKELKVLCDPRIRAALDEMGIELRSFANIAQQKRS